LAPILYQGFEQFLILFTNMLVSSFFPKRAPYDPLVTLFSL
jgi:hypothetical protein